MRAQATFEVTSFLPATLDPPPAEIATALPVGVAVIEKRFDGEISGRSTTIFTAAFDQATGVGTYVAMESFDGTIGGRMGTFSFTHGPAVSTDDARDVPLLVVPSSGTGELASITGTGGLRVVESVHEIWLDYELG